MYTPNGEFFVTGKKREREKKDSILLRPKKTRLGRIFKGNR